ncbi:hypothetical protein DSO57_1023440 [Entomophthora muscae]|uniref:Uncharacterized protein n=1 Tax=Entomophthora muscae TaxID=34485 RepID=A0ACC2UNU8_9FUNG|nr:hypothetical protein DSO57_1023440 [Entomophthora muscae]
MAKTVQTELKIHNKNISSELIPAAITRKPVTTKLLPAATKKMSGATVQSPVTLASPTHKPPANQASCEPVFYLLANHPATPCPPMPAGQSPSTP